MMLAADASELHLPPHMLEYDRMLVRRLNDGCSCTEGWFLLVVPVMFAPLLVMSVALLVLLGQLVFETAAMRRRRMLQLCMASS